MLTLISRIILIVLNGAIAIFGLSLFSVGVLWIEVELAYEKATQKQFVYVGAILMALGLLLGLTTALGCYGSLTKNKFLLDINTFMFLLLFLIYMDFGIVAFHLHDYSSPYMKDIDKELEDILVKEKEGWNDFYNYIHTKFQCCGFDGPEDFKKVLNISHPKSCCSDKNTKCVEATYKEGCTKPFQDYIAYNFIVSGAISFTIGVLTIIAAAFTYVIKKTYSTQENLANNEL